MYFVFFFSSRRRHTRLTCDWSSDVCSSDLGRVGMVAYSYWSIRRGPQPAANAPIRIGDHPNPPGRHAPFGQPERARRSEERRVGKECRSRWWPYREKKRKRAREKQTT